ncbi:MAG: class I SAM-dependent methyltransferase [Alphaproteobacteria bacterium]|nr:class I SAM-dependent methyltransferase [Alphaproteobacteria bacterium]
MLAGEPYFGLGLRALQGLPRRHKYLPPLLRKAVEHRPAGKVRILEIGSWAGASAVTWAKSLQALGRNGRVVCVDTWAPYLDLAVNSADVYAEMDRSVRGGIIKLLFDHNIRTSGVADLIKVKVGRSEEILPKLKKASFDLVYIDGNHSYAAVRADIANAKRLVRQNGVICGDDLEATADEIPSDLLEGYSQTAVDFVELAEIGKSFHPGVTKAVKDELGEVSCWEGVWAVVWEGGAGKRFDVDTDELPMPAHIAKEIANLPTEPETLDLIESDVAGHNIVRYKSRFFALPQSLGPVDIEHLPDAELGNLASDSDRGRLRTRLLSGASPVSAEAADAGKSVSDAEAVSAEQELPADAIDYGDPASPQNPTPANDPGDVLDANAYGNSAGRRRVSSANRPVVFMHIPKTAGANFCYACSQALGADRVLLLQTPAEWRYYKEQFRNKLLVAGHVTLPFIETVLADEEFHLITFLRDPIERAVSNYYHSKAAQYPALSGLEPYSKLFSLKELCEIADQPVRFVLNNLYARWLLEDRIVEDLLQAPDELFSRAFEKLEKFDYVGASERFQSEIVEIFSRFFPGVDVSAQTDELINNRFGNGVPYRHDEFKFGSSESMDLETCIRLRSLNEVDIRLYNHVIGERYPELKCFGLPASAESLVAEPDPAFAAWVAKQMEWKLSAAERAIIARDQLIRSYGPRTPAVPELVEEHVNGHNIVRWGTRFFGIPQSRGEVDLRLLSQAELAELSSDPDLAAVRASLLPPSHPTAQTEARPAMSDDPNPPVEQESPQVRPPSIGNGNGFDPTVHALADRMTVFEGALDARLQRLEVMEQDLTGSLGSLRTAITEAVERAQQAGPAAAAALESAVAERDARVAALERALAEAAAEREQGRKAMAEELVQRDRKLAALEQAFTAAMAETGQARTALLAELSQRDRKIAALDQALAAAQVESRKVRAELSAEFAPRDGRIAALEQGMAAALAETGQARAALSAELGPRDGRINALEQSLATALAETGQARSAFTAEFAPRDGRIAALEQGVATALAETGQARAALSAELAPRDGRIAALEQGLAAALAETGQARAALSAELAPRDGKIASLDQALAAAVAETGQARAALTAELTRRDSKIAALDQVVAANAAETGQLQIALTAELAQRDGKISALEQAIAAAVSEAGQVRTALTTELAQRDGRIAALDQAAATALANSGQAQAALASELAQRDGKVAALEQKLAAALAEARQARTVLAADMAERDSKIARLDQALAAVAAETGQAGAALRTELAQRDDKIAALDRALATAAAEGDRRQTLTDAQSAERDAKIAELQRATTSVAEETRQVAAALNAERSRSASEMAERDRSTAGLEDLIGQATKAMQHARAAGEAALSRCQEQIEALERRVTRAAEETGHARAGLEATVTRGNERVTELAQALAAVTNETREIGASLAATLAQIEERVAALDESSERRREWEQRVDASLWQEEEKGLELKRELATRASRAAALERDVALQAERLAAIEADSAEQQATFRGLLAQRDEIASALEAALGQRISAVEEALAGLAQHREQGSAVAAALGTRIAQESEQIAALKEALRTGLARQSERVSALEKTLGAGLDRHGERVSGLEATLGKALAQRDERLQRIEAAAASAGRTGEDLKQILAARAARTGALERAVALHAERLDGVEEDTSRWRGQLMWFPPCLNLLPLLTRKEFVRESGPALTVSAEAEIGHFLFGPYLTIDPGTYLLEILCRVTNVKRPEDPIVTVEIAAGDFVLGGRVLSREALQQPVRVGFDVPEWVREARSKIEFRFSHHQNGDIEFNEARLLTTAAPPAANRPRGSGGFLRRLRRRETGDPGRVAGSK